MAKPKILFIMHIPPPINGAAMVGEIIKNSAVINQFCEIDYINLTTSFELNRIGKGGISKLLTVLKIQSKVLIALFNNKYDLCYMTLTAKGAGFYKDLCIVTLLKIFRKNIIYHFHNKGVQQGSARWFNRLLYRFVFDKAQSILLSPNLYFDIKPYVRENSVYYCANGIPPIQALPSLKSGSNKNLPCKLLFLSHMMVEKGVLILLESCGILKKRGINFECHFVGDWIGITETEFSELVRKEELSNYVHIHGKKFGDDKINIYRQSDIFVLPTINDCFPLVLLEAMQHGLPIISTPEGGIPDIVSHGETGYLVPQHDTIALANALVTLIEQPVLRSKMSETSKARFEQYFTLHKFELNFRSILSKALNHE